MNTTNIEGDNTTVLSNNKNTLMCFFKNNENKITTIKGFPFYSGNEFKLPDTIKEADQMINEISNHMENITGFATASFSEAGQISDHLENESDNTMDDRITYKKLLIRALILIHWKFYYVNVENTTNRVEFIGKIFDKLYKCDVMKNCWGTDSVFTESTITKVMTSLLNGDELDIVMMNFPTKALHVYGW